ncbi:hypothetical protein L7F22_001641 [Adiantum nelumboides]|nr:hypothetical protein [Adiantum nelumboides]
MSSASSTPSNRHQYSFADSSISEPSTPSSLRSTDPSSSPYVGSSVDNPASSPARASNVSQASSLSSRLSRLFTPSSSRNSSFRASDATATARAPLNVHLNLTQSGRRHSPLMDVQPEPAGTIHQEPNQLKVAAIMVVERNGQEENAIDPAKLLTGDIVKKVSVQGAGSFSHISGKEFLFNSLKRYSDRDLINIEVQRRDIIIRRRAKLLNVNKKILQDLIDHSHHFTFEDYSLQECKSFQEEQHARMKVEGERLKCSSLQVSVHQPQIDTCYSMVVVPQRSSMQDETVLQRSTNLMRFNNMQDETVLQAMSWIKASQISGVPLTFLSIQIEPFVLELEQRSANNDLSSIVSTSTYGLQQSYRPARLDVVRAIRIWFKFDQFSEFKVTLQPREGDNRLGLEIKRTEEGFCHVTKVIEHTAADRANLNSYLGNARALGKLLLVTRVGNEKVLPWFISDGEVSCFNVDSICAKLAGYRDARLPAFIHILVATATALEAPKTAEAGFFNSPPSPASVFNNEHCAA